MVVQRARARAEFIVCKACLDGLARASQWVHVEERLDNGCSGNSQEWTKAQAMGWGC